jgi:hypothetical protein
MTGIFAEEKTRLLFFANEEKRGFISKLQFK